MVIHIDASRALDPRPTGVNVYAREIITGLASSLRSGDSIVLYAPDWLRARASIVFPELADRCVWKWLSWKPRFLWTQIRLAWEWFRADKTDAVFFAPAHVAPFFSPHNTVVTIHDIAFEILPDAFTVRERLFARFMTRSNARCARKIITPSEDTKREIVSRYGIDSKKIFVTPFAIPAHNNLVVDEKDVERVLSSYNISKPYILSIGRVEYKKGVDRLVRAFEFARTAGFEGDLVIVGKPGAGYERIAQIIDSSPYRSDIHELGFVSDPDVCALYAGARVFALATRYEGFGFNFLEAMGYRVPSVGFAVGSVPEVVGDSALLARSEQEFQEMLMLALTDEAVRSRLIDLGEKRVRLFDWNKTTELTYRELV